MDSTGLLCSLRINGNELQTQIDCRSSLIDVLRDNLGLTGTKKVCDMGNCGACTVVVDGRAVYACLLLALDCADRDVRTIEGVADDARLHPVQQAFIEEDAFQCGFCTPGHVMSMTALLDRNAHPSASEVLEALGGNLCRCGAYRNLRRAAFRAAGLPHPSSVPGSDDA